MIPRPDALPLSASGPHTVGVKTLELTDSTRDRRLLTELWYPASETTELQPYRHEARWHSLTESVAFQGRAYRDAPLCRGRFPLVMYAHGAPGSRLQSLYLTEHLASHGFIVASVDAAAMTYGDFDEQAYVSGLVDRPKDVTFVLDALERAYSEQIDTAKVGIAGYSFGGYTALAAAGAGLDFEQLKANSQRGDNVGYPLGFRDRLEPERGKQRGWQGDERVAALFIMAPWNGPALDLPQVSIPTFIAAGEDDTVAPLKRDARRIYDTIASEKKHLLVFERGGHNLFTDPCLPETRESLESWAHCSDPVWNKERANDIIKHAALAFFRETLLGEVSGYDVLSEQPALRFR